MKVYRSDDGDYFIRGETDPDRIAQIMETDEYVYDEAPEDMDWEVEIEVIQTGLFRFVPCSPTACGEHGWHLTPVKKRGRGVMEGVHFEARPVPVEFDLDSL